MLPPVDSATLEHNPGLHSLYSDLCARKLNPDGSTRDIKKQRKQNEMRTVGGQYILCFQIGLDSMNVVVVSRVPRSDSSIASLEG